MEARLWDLEWLCNWCSVFIFLISVRMHRRKVSLEEIPNRRRRRMASRSNRKLRTRKRSGWRRKRKKPRKIRRKRSKMRSRKNVAKLNRHVAINHSMFNLYVMYDCTSLWCLHGDVFRRNGKLATNSEHIASSNNKVKSVCSWLEWLIYIIYQIMRCVPVCLCVCTAHMLPLHALEVANKLTLAIHACANSSSLGKMSQMSQPQVVAYVS